MKNQKILEKIRELKEKEQLTEALKWIDEALAEDPDDLELYLEKGKILKHIQHFTEALNCFQKVLKIDPGHNETRNLKIMVQDILRYQQFDIYGSTNLSNDPWLDD